MDVSRGLIVGAAAAAIGVAVVVLGVRALYGDDTPGPAGTLPPDGVRSTELPRVDPSYWTSDRMRSARPAPMPEDK